MLPLQATLLGTPSPAAPAATRGVTASVVRFTSTTSSETQPVTVRRPSGASASPQGSRTPDDAGNTTRVKLQIPPLSVYSSTRCEPQSAINICVADRNSRPFGIQSPVLITVVAAPPAIGKRTIRLPSVSAANTCVPFSATP